jgi:hypothetical protein
MVETILGLVVGSVNGLVAELNDIAGAIANAIPNILSLLGKG